ncbi:phage tail assembly chaperone GT [Peribacillus butanolivorans]|uniref:phage tail assembly chaperone GT n=1 Tax=Peribacillus butanolivorans TaxID=421767 RepID=UPI003670DA77
MDKLILDLMKDGKDINEILSMPYHFLIEILRDKNNPKQEKSLIAAALNRGLTGVKDKLRTVCSEIKENLSVFVAVIDL